MADEEHLAVLRQGSEAWNAWREQNPKVRPDLSQAYLYRADLSGVDLSEVNLSRANLSEAILYWDPPGRTVSEAIGVLYGADLSRANLSGANLDGAGLSEANLSGANLHGANLSRADLSEANLSGARLIETVFADVDLSATKGLHDCKHRGPSVIDHRTLQRSGQLPLSFLRGCGLPDNLIDYLPSLLNQPIQFYSCFISYSSEDDEFAQRLHADLQNNGVRCWFDSEDMRIGDRLTETIDAAVRHRDKLLLILSESSIASAWVHKEVRIALAEEEQHGRQVLFPVRLDDAVKDTTEQWAHDIRRNHHIGDFRRWKDHDAYTKAFKRLLRDLKIELTT
jgi:uncharacterized protein YjbI with pentapeptide repeats